MASFIQINNAIVNTNRIARAEIEHILGGWNSPDGWQVIVTLDGDKNPLVTKITDNIDELINIMKRIYPDYRYIKEKEQKEIESESESE